MKMYFVDSGYYIEKLKSWGVNRFLMSYLNEKYVEKFYGTELFIDSGAFTAETQGVHIDIHKYCEWLLERKHNFTLYANLDVISSAEESYKNYEIMKGYGLNPLPAFHEGEDIAYLHKYLQQEDYIALGGLVGAGKPNLRVFLDKCFNIIKDYWPKKIHGFGLTAPWALQRYPFYSVDSTSWMSYKFGGLQEINGYATIQSKKRLFYLRNRDKYFILQKSVETYKQLEYNITKLWEHKGIIWK